MNIVSKIFLTTAILYLVACSDTGKSTTGTQVEVTNQQTEQAVQEPVQNTQIQSQQPIQSQSQTPSNNNAGVILNPPHGEPGHSCAVNVGDPLPSQAQNNNTQQPSNPVQINTSPSNTQGSVAAINPPHGEPGHDCTVPVGAPLNN